MNTTAEYDAKVRAFYDALYAPRRVAYKLKDGTRVNISHPSGSFYFDADHVGDVYCSPYWEGEAGVNLEVDRGDGEPVHSELLPFPLTGDHEADIATWLGLVSEWKRRNLDGKDDFKGNRE